MDNGAGGWQQLQAPGLTPIVRLERALAHLDANCGAPQRQSSPRSSRFPFPPGFLAALPPELPASGIPLPHFREMRRTNPIGRGHGDLPEPMAQELSLWTSQLAMMDVVREGLRGLHDTFQAFADTVAPEAAGQHAWIQPMTATLNTLTYDVNWAQSVAQARVNCLQAWVNHGPGGMAALHHAYFASSERPFPDLVTREYDREVGKAMIKAIAKEDAEAALYGPDGDPGLAHLAAMQHAYFAAFAWPTPDDVTREFDRVYGRALVKALARSGAEGGSPRGPRGHQGAAGGNGGGREQGWQRARGGRGRRGGKRGNQARREEPVAAAAAAGGEHPGGAVDDSGDVRR